MNQPYVKSVRLSDQQAREVLESLERDTRDFDPSRRAHERVAFHLMDVAVRIVHPEGGEGRYLVVARNLSGGGMSFLHGGFLHVGSRCEVTLPTAWGGRETIRGRVASCRHRQGQIHEIGVQFESHIDPRRFISDPTNAPMDTDAGVAPTGAFTGTLLYVDPSEADRRLLTFSLRSTKISINAVATLAAGIEAVRTTPPDVVLMELDLAEGAKGEEAIAELRGAPYSGPVVFLTGVSDHARLKAAKEADPADILLKPYSSGRLVSTIAPWMRRIDGSGPIHSSLDAGAETSELVTFYLEYVQGLCKQIKETIQADQLEPCLRACRSLMDTGAGYGFAAVANAARSAVGSLAVANTVGDAASDVQQLLLICERLSAEPAPAPVAATAPAAATPPEAATPSPSTEGAGA